MDPSTALQHLSTQTFFGGGIFGKAMNGMIRIPAFLTSATAVCIVGELAIRGLTLTLNWIGFQPSGSEFTAKITKQFANVRPYKDQAQFKTQDLIVKAICLVAIGVFSNEFARVVCGPAPEIYNNILSVIGPIRFDRTPYLENLSNLFYSSRLALTGS